MSEVKHQPSDFKRLLASRFLYSFGVQMQALVLGWQMYSLTHSPLHLGLIGLAEAIPALSLALFSGYWIDKSNPLHIFRIAMGLGLLSAFLLLFPHLPGCEVSLPHQVILLFTSSFLTGVARSVMYGEPCSTVPVYKMKSDA